MNFIRLSNVVCIEVVIFLQLFFLPCAYSYDNTITHRALTKAAFNASVLADRNQYLLRNFGEPFSVQVEADKLITYYNEEPVSEWVQEGSDFEDDGPDTTLCRASNHFHNPLKAWPQAQMTDGILGVLNVGISIKTNAFSD